MGIIRDGTGRDREGGWGAGSSSADREAGGAGQSRSGLYWFTLETLHLVRRFVKFMEVFGLDSGFHNHVVYVGKSPFGCRLKGFHNNVVRGL